MSLHNYRHFVPEEKTSLHFTGHVDWWPDETEIEIDKFDIFKEPIRKYEELYETDKTVVSFIIPPPWPATKWDLTDCENVKKVVNGDKLILVLDRRDEQFLASELISAMVQFRDAGFKTDNIRFMDSNLNYSMTDVDGWSVDKLNYDNAYGRFPVMYKYAYKDILPYSDDMIEKLKSNIKDYHYLCMNGTLHHYRTLLVAWLIHNGFHKKGLISAAVHIDSVDETFEHTSNAPNYFNREVVSDMSDEIFDDRLLRDFIMNKFENHIPLLLDHVWDDFTDDSNGLLPFTMTKNLPDRYKNLSGSSDFIKVAKQQIISSQQCEIYIENIKNHFGYLPYDNILESISGFINYENSYFSIVAESPPINYEDSGSYLNDNLTITFMKITEKTYRALCFHPVIFISSPFLLRSLRDYGFKTFPELFDESYDEITDTTERIKKVYSEIDRVVKMDKSKLHDLYVEILPKIVHNQKVLYSMKQIEYLETIYEKF
tara:strand:+ start:1968 stop:3425 length:1458 start_codon:yes stop_codon:yes gene_type:complete